MKIISYDGSMQEKSSMSVLLENDIKTEIIEHGKKLDLHGKHFLKNCIFVMKIYQTLIFFLFAQVQDLPIPPFDHQLVFLKLYVLG